MLAIGWLKQTTEISWRAAGGSGGAIEYKSLDLIDGQRRSDYKGYRELSGAEKL